MVSYGSWGSADKVDPRTGKEAAMSNRNKPRGVEPMDDKNMSGGPAEGEPQVDAEGTQDRTEGFGTDTTPRSEKPTEAKGRQTNQPASDFTLTLADDHPDADAVKIQDDQIKVASAMGRANAANNLVETREIDRQKAEAAKEAVEASYAANPLPEREMAMIPPDMYKAREQARVMAEAAVIGTNKTRPGGKFKVGGQWVDANGKALKDGDE